MKLLTAVLLAGMTMTAHAYSAAELREDCLAAEEFYQQKKSDPFHSVKVARCMSYIAGFADGYGVADYLADSVGLRLNAICLPRDGDLAYRMVRAVLAHLDRQPPNIATSTATLVAAALGKTFPCGEGETPRK